MVNEYITGRVVLLVCMTLQQMCVCVSAAPRADGDIEVLLRPHEVLARAAADGAAEVEAVEFHGAFRLLTVRLRSGRRVRTWHVGPPPAVGSKVDVQIAPAATPVVLQGGESLR